MPEDSINSRIKLLITKFDLNQNSFSVRIGENAQTIYNIIDGRKNKPSFKVLESILSTFVDISADWLLLGKGEMFKEDETQTRVVKAFKADDKTGVPLLNVVALAGFGNSAFAIEKQNVVGYYNIPEFKTADFFIPMKGKSMLPYYPHGAILACKIVTEESYLQWGKPYLIATKGQGLIVKRITKGKNAKHWTLVSDNDKLFQPYDIPVSEVDGTALILGCATLYFE